jgi:hypothetical protein
MENMQDIPRLYTALAEWGACMVFIRLVRLRYPKNTTAFICISTLFLQALFLIATGNVSLMWWAPCMCVAFAMMLLLIHTCCRLDLQEAAYYTLLAFLIAEFSASIEGQTARFFLDGTRADVEWVRFGLMLVIYAIIDFSMYLILRNRISRDGWIDLERKDFLSACAIALAAFCASNISYITKNTPFSGQYASEVASIRTITDFSGIALLYAHLALCCETKTRHELEAVQNVLQNQYQYYMQSRESIDLINYKYHDLKHQIAVLRAEQDPEKRSAFLNQMEDEIKQYEQQNKTGNSVLDTVLTGKTLSCNKYGITLTSVADGSLLDFMDTMDICSIFGNALDNAIESQLKIPDKEKRLIHVTVTKKKSFLIIRFENYFEGDLSYKEGLLTTTKKEKQFHGYGIKSIRHTVEKYEGAVDIETDHNWFNLRILIPLEEEEE